MSPTNAGHPTLAALREGRLAGATRLDLACGLTEFPPEIFTLADTLEVLNLSGNALRALPGDLHRLHRLRILFCSDNAFTELPRALGRCPQLEMVGFKANRIADVPAECFAEGSALRWLILTDNAIGALPASLGHCTQMQKLMLAGNRLRALPASLAGWRDLELLRISANRLEALPAWLLRLPRLAWLACAGNPFNEAHQAAAMAGRHIQEIVWHDLALGPLLGDGASGRIYAGEWRQPSSPGTSVAIKLFKGTMTSDGLPTSEMAAACVAGEGTTPMPVLGRVVGQPDGIEGLVFPRLHPGFKPLAGPPDFASCTRDVYPPTAAWTLREAREIALAVAHAARHLHGRGLMHGDLYAHNILCRVERGRIAHSVLTDLGAASFMAPDGELAATLERLDVLAFGHLLEELLVRCADLDAVGDAPPPSAPPDAATLMQQAMHDERCATSAVLSDLMRRCLLDDVPARPCFEDIVASLVRSTA